MPRQMDIPRCPLHLTIYTILSLPLRTVQWDKKNVNHSQNNNAKCHVNEESPNKLVPVALALLTYLNTRAHLLQNGTQSRCASERMTENGFSGIYNAR